MLGGTVVNVTGPCFELTDRIRCRFDNYKQVVCAVIDINQAACVQPLLYAEGFIDFAIAINTGNFDLKGQYILLLVSWIRF